MLMNRVMGRRGIRLRVLKIRQQTSGITHKAYIYKTWIWICTPTDADTQLSFWRVQRYAKSTGATFFT